MQKNAQLTEQNTALDQALAQAKEENETLQLSLKSFMWSSSRLFSHDR